MDSAAERSAERNNTDLGLVVCDSGYCHKHRVLIVEIKDILLPNFSCCENCHPLTKVRDGAWCSAYAAQLRWTKISA
ncbi:hypothetical protein INR49_027123 [Caranx melampygus]|nr:hypothetical protein INR49_027123 [Caranx melampygus]